MTADTDDLDAMGIFDLAEFGRCLACDVPRDLQAAFDAARKSGNATELRRVRRRIAATLSPDDVFKGEAGDELRKFADVFLSLGGDRYVNRRLVGTHALREFQRTGDREALWNLAKFKHAAADMTTMAELRKLAATTALVRAGVRA